MEARRVGPYEITRKLGSGGMGTVYYGKHVDTGREAAVKVLPASLAREEGFVARFTREIEALQKLSNPHIVQLYESGVDGETYFYAMEYVDGETLTNRLRREKRIAWQDVVAMSVQICVALKAAHDAGIIHRDLKPSNLMLTPDGQVKLTDFGVAQMFAASKLTVTGGIIGTAEYMSPEQAQGKRATKKSDIYSLGAVMYVMLTGRPPFSGKTSLDIIQKHRYGQFDRPSLLAPDIPHWLEELVCQLLDKDPDKRVADAYVLSRRLQEIVKKVELATPSGQTVALGGTRDGMAATVAIGGANTGPGGGTLMRDLFRAEIDRSHRETPVSRALNNTWVLVALLLLLIAGGFYWFRNKELTPEQMFEAGVKAIDAGEGPGWLAARDQYFKPLLESDPETWQDKVAPHLERIKQYEMERAFRPRTLGPRRAKPDNEADRFLQLAQSYQEMGNTAEAERTLVALESVLADNPEYADQHAFVVKLLANLREGIEQNEGRAQFLQGSLDRANELLAAGKTDEARQVWSALIELYDSDPQAKDAVEQARRNLNSNMTARP